MKVLVTEVKGLFKKELWEMGQELLRSGTKLGSLQTGAHGLFFNRRRGLRASQWRLRVTNTFIHILTSLSPD
jgi:hypothetical protein